MNKLNENICPICHENTELPVTINISKTEKCPYSVNNHLCLRCFTTYISLQKYKRIKCICNCHFLDISNNYYMCYGDVDHTSDDFVEKKLWNSLYYENKKCNQCKKTFENIEKLYKHYKYYGIYCFQLNKNKILFLFGILCIYLLYGVLIYYYLNFCTILNISIIAQNKKYCLEECNDILCNFLSKKNKIINKLFIIFYYLTINIFIENILNFCNEEKIIWKFKYQYYTIFVLCYILFILYLQDNNINDTFMFLIVKNMIEITFQIKVIFRCIK